MSDDYRTGYKKPPKHTQFQKGQSGNPAGRAKGAKSLKADLLEEFAEQIQVREGEREIKISKQRALIKSQMSRALKGSDRAAGKLFELCLKIIGIEEDAEDMAVPLTAEESEVLKNLEERILRKAASSTEKDEEGTP